MYFQRFIRWMKYAWSSSWIVRIPPSILGGRHFPKLPRQSLSSKRDERHLSAMLMPVTRLIMLFSAHKKPLNHASSYTITCEQLIGHCRKNVHQSLGSLRRIIGPMWNGNLVYLVMPMRNPKLRSSLSDLARALKDLRVYSRQRRTDIFPICSRTTHMGISLLRVPSPTRGNHWPTSTPQDVRKPSSVSPFLATTCGMRLQSLLSRGVASYRPRYWLMSRPHMAVSGIVGFFLLMASWDSSQISLKGILFDVTKSAYLVPVTG